MNSRRSAWGFSFLAAIIVIAASALPAHAKWLLLKNKTSVSSISFKLEYSEIELLIPLFFDIRCKGGTGSADLVLSAGGLKLSAIEYLADLKGCKLAAFEEVCAVASVGEEAETIGMSGGSGEASMEGEKILSNMSSTKFTELVFKGEECPFTEIDGRISGATTYYVLDGLADTSSKVAHLVKQSLSLGGSPMSTHDGKLNSIKAKLTPVSGGDWGVHLVGL